MNSSAYRYLINDYNKEYVYSPPKNFLIETKLQEIKKIIREYFANGNDENVESVVECLTGFQEVVEKGHVIYTKAFWYLPRISKWLLLGSGDKENIVKYDERVVREYFTILDLGILKDASTIDLSRYGEISMFPPKNPQLWKEMVNYCLSLIDLADSPMKGLTISYALYRFYRADQQLKEAIGGKRENLIGMMIRLTKLPSHQPQFTDNHSLMCHWTIKLIEMTGEKWNGILERKTSLLEEIQEYYLKTLINTLPTNLRERYFANSYLESYEIVTAIFNMVISCCLKNVNTYSLFEGEIASLDNNIVDNCPIITFASIILNNPDIELDELMFISLTKGLKLRSDNTVCRLLGVKLSSFLEKNPKPATPEISYSVTEFYISLRKKLNVNYSVYEMFEQYCEMFENDRIREHISNTILDQILDAYMDLRTENDYTHSDTILHSIEAFGRSSSLLDKRMTTLLVDVAYHVNSKLFLDVLASFILNRGTEFIALLDQNMCNVLGCTLESQLSCYCTEKWFNVTHAAFESGLFWKILEKSKQLKEPNFELDEIFKQGYTLELVEQFIKNRQDVCHDPPFDNLYYCWWLLMENVEKSDNIERGKKNEIYITLANLSLIERGDDWGHPHSVFIFLLFAELEENVEENMNIILQNFEQILSSLNQIPLRNHPFTTEIITRFLENIERFLNYFRNRPDALSSYQKNNLYDSMFTLIGNGNYLTQVQRIKDLVDENDSYDEYSA